MWTPVSLPTQVQLYDIWGDGGGTWHLCGAEGLLLRSEDDGASWAPLDTGYRGALYALAPLAGGALLVGCLSPRGPGAMLVVEASGKVRRVSAGREVLRGGGVLGLASHAGGVALVSHSGLWHSTDGGSFTQALARTSSLSSVAAVGPGRLVAAGYDDLRVSVDGGATWIKKNHEVTAHLSRVDGDEARGIYVVGYWDLLASQDGGDTWTHPLHDRAGAWRAVAAPGPGIVYVAGEGGRIASSTDGGKHFAQEHRSAGASLCQLRHLGDSLFALGAGGTLLRRAAPKKSTRRALVVPARFSTAKPARPAPAASPADEAESAAKLRRQVTGDGRFIGLQCAGLTSLAALSEFPQVVWLGLWGKAPLATLPVLPALEEVSLSSVVPSLAPLAAQPALARLTLEQSRAVLDGIDGLSSLVSLDLRKCKALPSLAPLAGCQALQHVYLPAGAGALAPLAACPALETLSLACRGVAPELVPPQVRVLSVEAGPSSLAFLSGLSRLRHLDYQSAAPLDDLGPLAGLTGLETLTLKAPQIGSLRGLETLHALRSLTITGNLDDLGPLAGLTGLETLILTENQALTRVHALATLTGLRTLHLRQGRCPDLGPLAGLTGLTELRLDQTKLTDVRPLAGLTGLRTLLLYRTKVADLSALAGLAALEELSLEGAPLRSLRGVEGMHQLRSLDISRTRVDDLGPLAGLTALTSLQIARLGPVRGGEALGTLSAVERIHADGTQFPLEPLRGLARLQQAWGFLFPLEGAALEGPAPAPVLGNLGPGLVLDGRIGLVRLPSEPTGVALSPDGRWVAVSLTRGPAAVWVFATKDARHVASFGEGYHSGEGVVFAPRGDTLYFSARLATYDDEAQLFAAPWPGGEAVSFGSLTRKHRLHLSLDAEGRWLAISSDRIDLWDLKAEALRETITCEVSYHGARAWFAPRGEHLYIWGLRPRVLARYAVSARREEASWEAPAEGPALLTLSDDERWLAAVGHNGHGTVVLDTQRGERLLPQRFASAQHLPPVLVSPDGSLLVTLGPRVGALRLPGGAEVEGPLSGLSGSYPAAATWARDVPLFAYAALAYRGEGPRLLWAPCVGVGAGAGQGA